MNEPEPITCPKCSESSSDMIEDFGKSKHSNVHWYFCNVCSCTFGFNERGETIIGGGSKGTNMSNASNQTPT